MDFKNRRVSTNVTEEPPSELEAFWNNFTTNMGNDLRDWGLLPARQVEWNPEGARRSAAMARRDQINSVAPIVNQLVQEQAQALLQANQPPRRRR